MAFASKRIGVLAKAIVCGGRKCSCALGVDDTASPATIIRDMRRHDIVVNVQVCQRVGAGVACAAMVVEARDALPVVLECVAVNVDVS